MAIMHRRCLPHPTPKIRETRPSVTYWRSRRGHAEYADIQLIAEAYDLLTHVAGLDAPAIAKFFEQWNSGDLHSFLIKITAKVLAKTDTQTGGPLVDMIAVQAEQKGTGTWTAIDALGLGVPLTGITEAVFARGLSALRDERKKAATTLVGPRRGRAPTVTT